MTTNMNLKRMNTEYLRKIEKTKPEIEELKNQKFQIKELKDQMKDKIQFGKTSTDGFRNLTSRHNSTISDMLPNLKTSKKNNLMKNKWRFNSNPTNSTKMYTTFGGLSSKNSIIAHNTYSNEYKQPNRINANSAIRSITPILENTGLDTNSGGEEIEASSITLPTNQKVTLTPIKHQPGMMRDISAGGGKKKHLRINLEDTNSGDNIMKKIRKNGATFKNENTISKSKEESTGAILVQE